ncbi:ribosome silencing factor [Allocoleopsis franciscana]|nr:ribosome silencing factor [Allocoleopsis franciscana]
MPSTLVSTNTQAQDMSKGLALTIAEAADDRKAGDIVILRVGDVSYLADFFVIVTGYSKAQVRAISQAIEHKVEMEWERRSLRTEGVAESSWILQDYGEVIVHILLPQEREFYNLEAFWGHAEQIEFQVSQPQQ